MIVLCLSVVSAESNILDYDLVLTPDRIDTLYVNTQFNADSDAYWEKVITSNIELESCSTSGGGYGCAIKNNTVTVFKDFIDKNVIYDEENTTIYVKSVSQKNIEIPMALRYANPSYFVPVYSDTELLSPLFRIKDHTTIGVSLFPIIILILLFIYIDKRRRRR